MPRVVIVCSWSGKSVFTGIERPAGDKLKGLANEKFACSACGLSHPVRRPFFEGEAPSLFHRWWNALDRRPEIAAEIGILMSCSATVEWYLPQLMSRLLSLHQNDTILIAGHFESFADRVDLLERMAARRKSTDLVRQRIVEFIPKLRKSRTIRNKYAHAEYALGPTEDSIIVTPFAGDARRKPKQMTETLESVVAEVNFFKQLICDLQEFLTPQPSL